MKISITYKLKKSDRIEEIHLSPEQYFDEIEADENFEEHGIEKYDHAKEYISEFRPDTPLEELESATIEMTGSKESDFVIKTNYYGTDTDVIYRKDVSGLELIIQSIRVAINCIVITRMERPNNTSEWTNINLNVGVNYNKNDEGEEKWYSSVNGEFIDQKI